jgi:hypothetical protein
VGLIENIMQTLPLSDALFTLTQQKVLGLLYGKPDQSFYANEIARWAKVGKGSLMRELDRLHRAGVLTLNRQGNQTHYQANAECPIYGELLGIVRKTFGIGEQLQATLAPLADHLVWAFIYGSIAKGSDHAGSDIDLMLIGENSATATWWSACCPWKSVWAAASTRRSTRRPTGWPRRPPATALSCGCQSRTRST